MSPPDHDAISILNHLQQIAVLVQGNWIVNSELVYEKDTVSADNGIPAELMRRARDYAVSSRSVHFFFLIPYNRWLNFVFSFSQLLLFTKNEYVKRSDVSSVIKLPEDEIQEIMQNLAQRHPNQGWKLIHPEDKDFSAE